MADLSSGGGPLQSVLGSIHKGIIAIFLGAGFFPLSGAFSQPAAVTGIGIVLFLVGCGFLISAIVTYLLSRWWGLLQDREK
jgi:protein-S-isoprenylcysteine O-methyltransferase Ste14